MISLISRCSGVSCSCLSRSSLASRRLGRLGRGRRRGTARLSRWSSRPARLIVPAADRALICRLASWSLGLSFLTCSQQVIAFCQLSFTSWMWAANLKKSTSFVTALNRLDEPLGQQQHSGLLGRLGRHPRRAHVPGIVDERVLAQLDRLGVIALRSAPICARIRSG